MKFRTLFLLIASLGLLAGSALAQAPSGLEQRLREQVKSLTTQLRTAETDKAALQADKAALEEKLAAGAKRIEELAKQAAADKDAATKEHERLASEINAAKKETSDRQDLLTKSQTQEKLVSALATKTKADLDRAVADNVKLKDIVAGQRTRNQKMHEIAMEILDRYAKFGLGTALTAREPFVGITRTKLETMVEEYTSAVDAQRIRIGGGTVPGSAKPASPTKERPADGKPGEKKAATKP
jgi:chromosome segregation ATPase